MLFTPFAIIAESVRLREAGRADAALRATGRADFAVLRADVLFFAVFDLVI